MSIKKAYFYSILISIFIMAGCDNPLNETPPSKRTVDSFYKNVNQANVALNGVYSELWRKGLGRDGEFPIDLSSVDGDILKAYRESSEDTKYDQFSITPSARRLEDMWTTCYLGVNRANGLIEKIADADIDDSQKNHIVGQAEFMRALYYFDLVRLFGGVPLYTTLTTNESQAKKERASRAEIYDQIISDLSDAEQALMPYSASDHSDGKATSGAAQALLANVYLQDKQWNKAAQEAKKVIDGNHFSLLKDYAKIFDQDNKNNDEVIFSIQYLDNQGHSAISGNHLPYEFAPANRSLQDGTAITFAPDQQVQARWTIEKSFYDQWPDTYRKQMSVANSMPFYFLQSSGTLVNQTIATQKTVGLKYYDIDKSSGHLKTGVNDIILRYADVLLMYAEALNQANGGPTPAAYDAINKVRERARGVGTSHEQPASVLPDLSGLTQQQFNAAVLRERGHELAMEGQRRFDLIRFGKFVEFNEQENKPVAKRDTLYPIPQPEIDKNPNLKQNPGWE